MALPLPDELAELLTAVTVPSSVTPSSASSVTVADWPTDTELISCSSTLTLIDIVSSDCIVNAVISEADEDELPELVVDVSVLSDELSEEDVVAEEVVAEEVPPVPEETEPVIPDALFEVPFPDALPVPDVPDEAPSCVPALLSFVPCEVVPDVELSELSVLDDALPEPDPVLPDPAFDALVPDVPVFPALLSAAVAGAVRTNVIVPSSWTVTPDTVYPLTEAMLLTSSE